MEYSEFLALASITPPPAPTVDAGDLLDQTDRTLVLGRQNRNFVHIALTGGRIRHALYIGHDEDRAAAGAGEWDYSAGETWPLTSFEHLTAYPELCDFAFMALLRGRGVKVAYEPYDHDGQRTGVPRLPF